MRLLAKDADGAMHLLSVADIYYDEEDRELTVTTAADLDYSVEDIDRYSAETLMRDLFETGKAELPPRFTLH